MNTSLNARKICSVYEIIKEMYFSLLNNGKQYDCLWINYLLHLMDVINRTVLKNVSRKDIKAAKSHYKEITELQRDVIIIYYNLLSFMGEKISNFSKTLEFIDEITTPFGWFTAETVKIIKYIISEREKLIKKNFWQVSFSE